MLGLLGGLLTGSALAQTVATLTPNTTDTNRYIQQSNNGSVSGVPLSGGNLLISFTLSQDGPVELSLSGFDVDVSNEVLIEGAGFSTFLRRGINNGDSPEETFSLGSLSAGSHQYTISNDRNPNWIWGVSNLLITTSSAGGGGTGGGSGGVTLGDLDCMDGEAPISDGTRFNCGSPDVSVVDPVISALLARIAALESKVVYEIGDTGPGGGIVFKVNSSGTSGLEAAPSDLPRTISCNTSIAIPGLPDVLFAEPVQDDPNSGAYNTRQIRAVCGDDSAAAVAATYVWPEGQVDGYLPSIEELALLAAQQDAVGGFQVSTYLSSSQAEAGSIWVAFISDRSFNTDEFIPVSSARRLRPIRAF